MKIRIIMLFLSAMLMSHWRLPLPDFSSYQVNLLIETAITPLSDELIWITKTENGKIYKRLYNTSTNMWVGDWIYVGECP